MTALQFIQRLQASEKEKDIISLLNISLQPLSGADYLTILDIFSFLTNYTYTNAQIVTISNNRKILMIRNLGFRFIINGNHIQYFNKKFLKI